MVLLGHMRQYQLSEVVRVRVTRPVLERLDRMADDAGTTRSDMVRRLIIDNSRQAERQTQTTSER